MTPTSYPGGPGSHPVEGRFGRSECHGTWREPGRSSEPQRAAREGAVATAKLPSVALTRSNGYRSRVRLGGRSSREPKTRWHSRSPAQPHSTEANQALLPAEVARVEAQRREAQAAYDARRNILGKSKCARAV